MFKRVTMGAWPWPRCCWLAPAASAQSTMIRGKVVDKEGKPVPGATVAVEFKGGVNRKYHDQDRSAAATSSSCSTESGEYQVTVTGGRRRVAERSRARPARAGRRGEHRPGPEAADPLMPRRPR